MGKLWLLFHPPFQQGTQPKGRLQKSPGTQNSGVQSLSESLAEGDGIVECWSWRKRWASIFERRNKTAGGGPDLFEASGDVEKMEG